MEKEKCDQYVRKTESNGNQSQEDSDVVISRMHECIINVIQLIRLAGTTFLSFTVSQ